MSWFKEWFNSPYYHLLYDNRDSEEAATFINNLFYYLKPKKELKILDVACGRGRHAVYINRKGYNLDAFDLSKTNIDFAKQSETPSLNFFIHDMRVPFSLNNYGLALNLFTSMGFFDDRDENQKVFNAFNLCLHDDGLLVIDFMNVDKIRQNLINSSVEKRGSVFFRISRQIKNNKVVKTIEVEDESKKYKFQEQVSCFTLSDFERFLNNAQFSILDKFGDYSLSTFDAKESDRLIIISKKRELLISELFFFTFTLFFTPLLLIILYSRLGLFFKSQISSVLYFSGFYLLSITLLHLMPEVFSTLKIKAGFYIIIGFCLQLFLDFISGGVEHGHQLKKIRSSRISAPIIFGLSIHSFLEVTPLVMPNVNSKFNSYMFFIAILLHKIPITLALFSIIGDKVRQFKNLILIIIFSLSAPFGILAANFFSQRYPDLIGILMSLAIGIIIHVSSSIIIEGGGKNHGITLKRAIIIFSAFALSIVTQLFE